MKIRLMTTLWLMLTAMATAQSLSSTTMVTLSVSGAPLDNDVLQCLTSNDGHTVVFRTTATNVLATPTPANVNALFARDTVSGQIDLLVTDAVGNPVSVSDAKISGDARYVAYAAGGVSLLDRQTGVRTLLSRNAAGLPASGSYHNAEDISADGRYVLLLSDATDLPGSPGGFTGFALWRIDRLTGVYEPVTVTTSGAIGGASILFGDMSSDGRYVAFTSSNPNLVANDTNGVADTFVRDMTLGTTERVSVTSAGNQQSGLSQARPSLSDDARFIAFRISSTTIATNGIAVGAAIAIRDRVVHTTEFLAVTPAGTTAIVDFAVPQSAQIVPAGNLVYFRSTSNLVPGTSSSGLWVKNLVTGLISPALELLNAPQTSAEAVFHQISQDGSRVGFSSISANLVVGPTTNSARGFVAEATCSFTSGYFGSGHAGSGGVMPFLFANAGGCSSTAAISLVGALGGASSYLLVGARDFTPAMVGQAEILVDLAAPVLFAQIPTNGFPGAPGTGSWFLSGDVTAFRGVAVALQVVIIDPGATGGFATTGGVSFAVL